MSTISEITEIYINRNYDDRDTIILVMSAYLFTQLQAFTRIQAP
jgi:hypothetical protein